MDYQLLLLTLLTVKMVISVATSNTGKIIQTVTKDSESNGFVKLIDVAGTINVGDTIEGTTSGATGVVTSDVGDRMLINVERRLSTLVITYSIKIMLLRCYSQPTPISLVV